MGDWELGTGRDRFFRISKTELEFTPIYALSAYMRWEFLIYLFAFGALVMRAAGDEFNPKRVVRPFDPIQNPELVSAQEAGELVRDDELVLGVVVNKEARAYPINMLTNPTREIINDKVGGRAIAATW